MTEPFFLNSNFLCGKKSDKSKASKNSLKMGVYIYIIACIYNKNKLNLKKGLCHALQLDMLFQTKKQLTVQNEDSSRNLGYEIRTAQVE